MFYLILGLLPPTLAVGLWLKLQYSFKKLLLASSLLSLLIIVAISSWTLYAINTHFNHEPEVVSSFIILYIKYDLIQLAQAILYNAFIIWVLLKIKPYPVTGDETEAKTPWMHKYPIAGGLLWGAIAIFIVSSVTIVTAIANIIERAAYVNDAGSAAFLLFGKILFFVIVLLPAIATNSYYNASRETTSHSSLFVRGFLVTFLTSIALFYAYAFFIRHKPLIRADEFLESMLAITLFSTAISFVINMILAFIMRKKWADPVVGKW